MSLVFPKTYWQGGKGNFRTGRKKYFLGDKHKNSFSIELFATFLSNKISTQPYKVETQNTDSGLKVPKPTNVIMS